MMIRAGNVDSISQVLAVWRLPRRRSANQGGCHQPGHVVWRVIGIRGVA
jgi:hypothetical protein